MAVNPMAGMARTLPAMIPFAINWRTFIPGPRSDDFDQLDLAVFGFAVAEPAIDDVAFVVEVTRTTRTVVIDVLSVPEKLQTLDCRVCFPRRCPER